MKRSSVRSVPRRLEKPLVLLCQDVKTEDDSEGIRLSSSRPSVSVTAGGLWWEELGHQSLPSLPLGVLPHRQAWVSLLDG